MHALIGPDEAAAELTGAAGLDTGAELTGAAELDVAGAGALEVAAAGALDVAAAGALLLGLLAVFLLLEQPASMIGLLHNASAIASQVKMLAGQ